jgi:DNA-binding NarL/FixJ family response regulator
MPVPPRDIHFLKGVKPSSPTEQRLLRIALELAADLDLLDGLVASDYAELPSLPELTPRENEVLKRILSGDTNRVAAQRMGISTRTVELHRANAMHKLGVRNSTDLIRTVLTHLLMSERHQVSGASKNDGQLLERGD